MNRILQLGTKITSRSDRLISSGLSTLASETQDPLLRLSSFAYDVLGKSIKGGIEFYKRYRPRPESNIPEHDPSDWQPPFQSEDSELLSTTKLILERTTSISEKLDKFFFLDSN